jgi:hypothetical protein
MQRREFIRCLGAAGIGALLSSSLPSCSNKPEKQIFSLEGMAKLESIVDKYEYGQYNILDGNLKIIHDPVSFMLLLDPFYHYDKPDHKGTCFELMNEAYAEIRAKLPDYQVMHASGVEPDLFYDKIDPYNQHYFLLLSGFDPLDGVSYTEDPDDIADFVNQGPLLVDPSFHKVKTLSGSDYEVHSLFNHGEYDLPDNSLYLDTDFSFVVPLCQMRDGRMVHLAADYLADSLLILGFQEKRKDPVFYDLNEDYVTRAASYDPTLSRFVNVLRGARIETGSLH